MEQMDRMEKLGNKTLDQQKLEVFLDGQFNIAHWRQLYLSQEGQGGEHACFVRIW